MILFYHILLSIDIIGLYSYNLTHRGYNYANFVKYISIILVTVIPYQCVIINIIVIIQYTLTFILMSNIIRVPYQYLNFLRHKNCTF